MKYFLVILLLIALLELCYQNAETISTSALGQYFKQNFIIQGGKVVPLTILSEEDSKRPCKDCHPK